MFITDCILEIVLLVAGSIESIIGPLPPHLPLKTPGMMVFSAKPSPVNISLIAEAVEFKSTGLTIILDFNLLAIDMRWIRVFGVGWGKQSLNLLMIYLLKKTILHII